MKTEKVEKLAANLNDETKHVIYIRNLKQTSKYGMVLKKCIESSKAQPQV